MSRFLLASLVAGSLAGCASHPNPAAAPSPSRSETARTVSPLAGTLADSGVIQARLDAAGAALPDGRIHQVWLIPGTPERPLELRVYYFNRQPGFNLLFTVVDSTGRELARDSARTTPLDLRFPGAGTYRLIVTTRQGSATRTGDYGFHWATTPLGGGGGVLTRGVPVTDTIGGTDPRRYAGGAHFQEWRFAGSAGEAVELEMTSTQFDAVLEVRNPLGGPMASQTGGVPGRSARLTAALKLDGEYRVLVSGSAPRSYGEYRLRLAAAPAGCGGGMLAPGQWAAGRLESSDPELLGGTPTDEWMIRGAEGQLLLAEFRSDEVDARVLLMDSTAIHQVAGSGTGGAGEANIVRARLPRAGRYWLIVGGATRTGTYRVRVRTRTLVAPAGEHGGTLMLDGEAESTIQETDSSLDGTGRLDLWRFTGATGQLVQIDMTSATVDPFLILQDPTGRELARDDDGGEGTAARIRFRLPRSGTFRVVATTYAVDERGSYRISLEAPDDSTGAGADTTVLTQGIVAPIRKGQTLSGQLGAGDPVLADRSAFHAYRYEGRAGEVVTLEVRSSDLDAYAVVQDRTGKVLARDDDSGGGLDARLRYTLPYTGTYRLIANAYRPGTYGTYQIAVR
jgi:hypothetical protein